MSHFEYLDNLSEQVAQELIDRRQRQILVHSYLYYDRNENIVSDHVFDQWSCELVQLAEQYPEANRKSEWFEAFRRFDGSSGFDLPFRVDSVVTPAERLLKICGRPSLFS